MEFKILNKDLQPILSVNLLVSGEWHRFFSIAHPYILYQTLLSTPAITPTFPSHQIPIYLPMYGKL
jgi:hypothetical protein